MALHAQGEGGAHLTHVVRVLAVGLLGPSPRRMPEDVHAHPTVEIGAHGPQLLTDGGSDALLEVDVPGGAPGHADREAGRLVDDHSAWAVGEGETLQPEPLHPAPRNGLLW